MFETVDVMESLISEITEQSKSLPAGRQTVIKGTWGSSCLSADGIRLQDNGMSRGAGPSGARQDREWEIARGLRPELTACTMAAKADAFITSIMPVVERLVPAA